MNPVKVKFSGFRETQLSHGWIPKNRTNATSSGSGPCEFRRFLNLCLRRYRLTPFSVLRGPVQQRMYSFNSSHHHILCKLIGVEKFFGDRIAALYKIPPTRVLVSARNSRKETRREINHRKRVGGARQDSGTSLYYYLPLFFFFSSVFFSFSQKHRFSSFFFSSSFSLFFFFFFLSFFLLDKPLSTEY